MSVYIDNFGCRFGRMRMSHMIADTLPELHAMADKIGVRRKWFQSQSSIPHYDICKAKRELAISFGAVPVYDRKRFVEIFRRVRQEMMTDRGPQER